VDFAVSFFSVPDFFDPFLMATVNFSLPYFIIFPKLASAIRAFKN